MKNRAGFSLIELVLAIVIIAISVMTIPLMLSQSSNNDSFSIMQESILAARTKMGNILSYEWDTKSVDNNSSVTYIRVLDVQKGDSELDRNETGASDNNRRIGHVKQSFRRRLHHGSDTNKTFPSDDGNDANATALNHFNGQFLGTTLALDGVASEFDYVIRDFNMTTTVCYVSDSADYNAQTINFDFNTTKSADIKDVNKSTNIKMIEIFVQSLSGQPFRFRAFSSNIGQTELLELDTSAAGL